MPKIDIEDVKEFANGPVMVAILDRQGDQAPFVKKDVKKIELCPEQTHIRIYFDTFYFFAIPLTSQVTQTNLEWAAYDDVAELSYVIRRENESP